MINAVVSRVACILRVTQAFRILQIPKTDSFYHNKLWHKSNNTTQCIVYLLPSHDRI